MNHFIPKFLPKFLIGMVLGFAAVFLLTFNALLLWVATGPRSLNTLSPYIITALTPADQSYSLTIGETWLVWDGWKHPVDIRLRDVGVLGKDHATFSKLPEISVGLHVISLLWGEFLPTSLTITHPALNLYQHDDRSISFGFQPTLPQPTSADTAPATAAPMTEVPLQAILAPLIAPDSSSNLRKLRHVRIIDADISVGSLTRGTFFKASDAQMVFKRTFRGMSAYGSATMTYGEHHTQVNAQFAMPRGEEHIEGEVRVADLMPGALSDLFADIPEISGVKCPVNAQANLQLTLAGELERAEMTVDVGQGTIEVAALDTPLNVERIHAEGVMLEQPKTFTITQLQGDISGMQLQASGTATHAEAGWGVNADVNLRHIVANDLHDFWPIKLAPQTRDWVTSNITGGVISQTQAHFRINPGDLSKEFLPKEDVDADIILSGSRIRYLPEHPALNDVEARIHIDGVSLNATIASANFLKHTALSAGNVTIADLNADNPYINVSFDAKTLAADVVRILKLPRLEHAKALNLSEDKAEGSVAAHGALGFYFFETKNTDEDLTYDIKADVKGVSSPGFIQKFDIKEATGSFHIDNKMVEFKGTSDVNGATLADSKVTYLFTPDSKDTSIDTRLEIDGTVPVEVLPRFGYPAFDFLKGKLGVKANVELGKDTERAKVTLDLNRAAIDLPWAKWKKPDKEAATLEFAAQTNKNQTHISEFTLTGPSVKVHGEAELDANQSGLRSVVMDHVTMGNTALSRAVYEKLPGGMRLEASGATFDATPWTEGAGDSDFSFAHFPAVALALDLKQVVLGKNRTLKNLQGTLTCDEKRCTGADLQGTTMDGKAFEARILYNPKGVRQLAVHAQNGGAFLKAVGVIDSMEGGIFTVTGTYDDSGATSSLKAVADSDAFVVKDAPVLAKMLSLASLTGIFDTLQGKGIEFKKLRAPFTLAGDVITFQDAKAYGDAVGMTLEGTMTFPQRTLDLKGTLVPSYSLNTAISKVPLVGKMLTGGDGQGVFAARYSIKGGNESPDVSVNPLSILTPGFLRNVFDVFDKPAKNIENQPSRED